MVSKSAAGNPCTETGQTLTPLELAELADPRPIDKKMARLRDDVDQDNDKLGIRYRNGKWFDLASGQEIPEAEALSRPAPVNEGTSNPPQFSDARS